MTVLENYFALVRNAGTAKDEEEYKHLANLVVKYRDNNFTKSDWEQLISQSRGRAKFEYTRMMKAKFPD